MDPESGVVTDSTYRVPTPPSISKELREYSEAKLREAEERENRRLNEPGLIDKLMDGIDKVKKLLAGKKNKKQQQQIIQNKTQNQK